MTEVKKQVLRSLRSHQDDGGEQVLRSLRSHQDDILRSPSLRSGSHQDDDFLALLDIRQER